MAVYTALINNGAGAVGWNNVVGQADIRGARKVLCKVIATNVIGWYEGVGLFMPDMSVYQVLGKRDDGAIGWTSPVNFGWQTFPA